MDGVLNTGIADPAEPGHAPSTVLLLITVDDVLRARLRTRVLARAQNLSLREQTLLVTAASMLGSRTILHRNGGAMRGGAVHDGVRRGVQLVFASDCSEPGPGRVPGRDCSVDTSPSDALADLARFLDSLSIDSPLEHASPITATEWAT